MSKALSFSSFEEASKFVAAQKTKARLAASAASAAIAKAEKLPALDRSLAGLGAMRRGSSRFDCAEYLLRRAIEEKILVSSIAEVAKATGYSAFEVERTLRSFLLRDKTGLNARAAFVGFSGTVSKDGVITLRRYKAPKAGKVSEEVGTSETETENAE